MPLPEATALVERSARCGTQVLVQKHSASEDQRALHELAECFMQFAPCVGWQTLGPQGTWSINDGLLADITGTSRLFGGEVALVQQADALLRRRWGYQARWAVADTAAAAWACGRFGRYLNMPQPSDPSHPIVLPRWSENPDQAWRWLEPLPIAALRLSPEVENCLSQLGIPCIGQLAALPAESIVVRFGPLPLQRLRQLTGEVVETIVPLEVPKVFQAEQELEYATASRVVVEDVAGQLMERVAAMLAAERLGALELELRLECEAAGRVLPLRIGFFEPTARADHWRQLARMQFEQAPLPAAVARISLQVLRMAALPLRAGELFPLETPTLREDQELAELVDRLVTRLGSPAVQQPYLTWDRQPEYAYGGRSYPGTAAARRSRSPSPAATTPRVARPLLLHQPPLPLEVMAVVPEGAPVRCRTSRFQFQVVRWWGPERIETGWWRGTTVRRDYYRVEAEDGRHFWVFCRLNDGRWFLQGEFA